ncbi:MAG TPA: ATPase, T2SS/T4P/T4SS family [Fibrobacteria bacterium]|nr:ATPase, T2SS/T4P/T4SS family [Fibrobacteria bacterium]
MEPTSKPQKPRMLGEKLVDSGLISPAQLQLALREQKRKGGFLGETLESLGFVSAEAISRLLANETHTEFVDVLQAVVEPDVLALVPREIAVQYHLLPLNREGRTLTVAMADTFDVVAIDAVEKLTNLTLDVLAAPQQAIMDAIGQKYVEAESLDDLVDKALSAGVAGMAEEAGKVAPLVRLVDQILALALRKRATDIHIAPEEGVLRIRFRIDGILYQEALLPKALQQAVIARLKIMANLDITEMRSPQDGRITFQLGRRQVDLRASTLPTQYGESVVLRILDKGGVVLELDSLGISEHDRTRFQKVLKRPHGIILVTGPTGSGKTTTLYAALAQIDSMTRSVFTLEDPVEYSLPMIRQTQIAPDIGMTFAAGLRSLLRQDPDVILVGEIRDEETAQLATRAALTGHLVFSTLHTNSSAAAIPRLINMGVEPYLLASALVAVVAQRLVRRVCRDCAQPVPDPLEVLAQHGVPWTADQPPRLMRGKGCPACWGTGYLGRVAVYETLVVDEAISQALRPGVQEDEIRRLGAAGGLTTLAQDALRKAALGIVDLEDAIRVVG